MCGRFAHALTPYYPLRFPHVNQGSVNAKNAVSTVVRVVLPYRDDNEFLKREFALLGRSGSFLPGVELPCGALVAFELGLPTGASLVRGEGRVLGHVASRRGERGAVIRFVRLDAASRALVEHAKDLLIARQAQDSIPHHQISVVGRPPPTAPGAEAMLEDNGNGNSRSRNNGVKSVKPAASSPAAAALSEGGKNVTATSMEQAFQDAKMEDSASNGLYLVAGSKGGVGKSMVTMALVDLLREQGKNVFLVECDNSNPDVWKAHKDELRCELVNLDEAEGWIRLLNICDSNRDHVVVVNTAARNNAAVTRFGSTLNNSLDELGRELVTFWVINRQRDSLELLREFTSAIPRSVLHVVRNGYFGEERKFELYNSSSAREQIEKKGGKSITFADLADRVADDLYSKHLSIGAATRTLPLGNRAELSRWRNEVKKGFGSLLNGGGS
jgi:CobQ/CobB/MinD/ParA nucleotide binding domain